MSETNIFYSQLQRTYTGLQRQLTSWFKPQRLSVSWSALGKLPVIISRRTKAMYQSHFPICALGEVCPLYHSHGRSVSLHPHTGDATQHDLHMERSCGAARYGTVWKTYDCATLPYCHHHQTECWLFSTIRIWQVYTSLQALDRVRTAQ